MIHIIGGYLRGKKIQIPPGPVVRPTGNRVREALFNVLEHHTQIAGFTVLDLFAGSGALGIEALSRGAKRAYFVESSKRNLSTLHKNLEACGFKKDVAKVITGHAGNWVKNFSDRFQPCLVFVDPPFQEGLYDSVLLSLALCKSISKGSIVVVESPKSMEFQWPLVLNKIKRKIYGNVAVQLLEKS